MTVIKRDPFIITKEEEYILKHCSMYLKKGKNKDKKIKNKEGGENVKINPTYYQKPFTPNLQI